MIPEVRGLSSPLKAYFVLEHADSGSCNRAPGVRSSFFGTGGRLF
ncbi:hypothetical protein EJB05_24228, partial [Eragrostis curvula]